MKLMKKYWLLLIMIIISIVLIIINIIYFSKSVTCTYNIKYDNYKSSTKILINHNKKKIVKTISSDNNDILNKEKKLHKNKKFNTKINKNILTAKKQQNIKNYLKEIDNYKKVGFKCH